MKELLEYQKIDEKLRKAKANLVSSESRKKASSMQDYLKESQSKLVDLDKTAENSLKQLNQLQKQCEEILNKINGESVKDRDLAELEKLFDQLNRLEREIYNAQNRIVNINKDFEILMKNAKNAKTNLMFYKQEYEKLKEQEGPERRKLEEELAKCKMSVKPELLAKYNQKAEGKIFPIFVPLTNNRCGGCRMEIPAGKLKDIKAKDYIECENCGRYIYDTDK